MKIKFLLPVLCIALLMQSCTLMLLNELEGGHSPMMQLNGEWDVQEYTRIENGTEEPAGFADRVHLDATKDVGDYCMGEWMEIKTPATDADFLWGIDPEGAEFVIHEDQGDTKWRVIEQEKNFFHVEREENGVVYRMKLDR